MSRSGLVNAHTHLEITLFAHLYPAQTADFTDWVQTLIAARSACETSQYQHAIEEGISALRESGTAAVGDISSTGLSVKPLLDSDLSGVVYYEVLGTAPEPARQRLESAKRKISEWRKRERADMRVGLSIHAPYSCHPQLFQAGAAWCVAEQVPLCIHLAESAAEVQLLTEGTGPLRELERRLGVPPIPSPGLRPLPYLRELGVLKARPLLVHMVHVTEDEVAKTCAAGYSVVHCPRSNRALRCGRFPLEIYRRHNVTVALGTDSLASSPSLDVSEEIDEAEKLQHGQFPRAAFERMAREAGRKALGLP